MHFEAIFIAALLVAATLSGNPALAAPSPKSNPQATCAQWCAASFGPGGASPAGRNCTSLAAQGGGPCYGCGPMQPARGTQAFCEAQCKDTASDAANCGGCGNAVGAV
ncbi:hypothetical protein DFJ74DRAFT_707731 [Hyaloraphidium curvatum]|nr:hypothetical protein DFJ74DRAFT_707731 [Hyaloraphidium curvatum]